MAFENILPPPRFNLTPEEMSGKAAYILELAETAVRESTSSIEPGEAIFANVIIPVDIRTAAAKAPKSAQEAWEFIYDTKELFLLINAVIHQKPADLDEKSTRLLADLHSECIENGLSFPEADMKRYSEIRHRRCGLRSLFVANLATDPGVVFKSDAELAGLSKSKLESFEADEQGRRKILRHRTNANVIMRQCTNKQTRKDIWAAKECIYPNYAKYLREGVLLPDEGARLLGFSSYNNQLVVMDLLKTMGTKLNPLVKVEMDALRALHGDGEPMRFRDLACYDSQMWKGRNVNSELVAEYFPAVFVLGRMLEIFEKILHLKIVEVSNTKDDKVWHPDVVVYKVRELGGVFAGHLYMDLYPREGKYNGSADFNIRPSYIDREGKYILSATALICNVTLPTKDTPALLHHSDFVTIFHELGHEFFCCLLETLKHMSCHYSYLPEEYRQRWQRMSPCTITQPEKQIPSEMVLALTEAKNVKSAIWAARQVGLSVLDPEVLYYRGNRAAGCRRWSEVGQRDPYPRRRCGRRASEIRTNPEAGLRYRQVVLDKGGSVDETRMVTAFLGREPNSDAYLGDIGAKCSGDCWTLPTGYQSSRCGVQTAYLCLVIVGRHRFWRV
ncbi:Peptidase M3A/M3B [Metarhizium album ARSEF 1941]|uniref:Peptidase M3A/M3B n=1 Tax=Metarhizium album (strain ARSEF 1941) TaxID=1081103 RepID=A0A0B2WZH0_METAS|nr:Peptidase M3A/M3B [Metarhizium album ARSEF 1941]KHN98979.1 Peptidase M3A/M3B [Metarhizium album ARSEF 1941]